jgi:serine/threonine protein kinase
MSDSVHSSFPSLSSLPLVDSHYHIDCLLSSGSYGTVYRVFHLDSSLHAMKFISLPSIDLSPDEIPTFIIREFEALQHFSPPNSLHPNLLPLEELCLDEDSDSLALVFPLAGPDLSRLFGCSEFHSKLNLSHIKRLLHDSLTALHVIHSFSLVHRDIKPANLLMSFTGSIQLIDFGASKRFSTSSTSSPCLTSLWYRSPELLLGSCAEDTRAADIFAIGICLIEWLNKGNNPFSACRSEIHQLSAIFELFGTPSLDDELCHLPHWKLFQWKEQKSKLENFIKEKNNHSTNIDQRQEESLSSVGLSLLQALINLNPGKRPSAFSALSHPWFHEDPPMAEEQKMKELAEFACKIKLEHHQQDEDWDEENKMEESWWNIQQIEENQEEDDDDQSKQGTERVV